MAIPSAGTVMDDVKAHLIFWLPAGYSFAPGVPDGDARHMALVERLFNDLSGLKTYNLLTRYHDNFPQFPELANDPTHGYYPNRVRVAGTYVETRPFPQAPLSDTNVEAEITQVGAATGHSPRSADFRHDTSQEPNEAFTLKLSNTSNNARLVDPSSTATILNNDSTGANAIADSVLPSRRRLNRSAAYTATSAKVERWLIGHRASFHPSAYRRPRG